MNNLPKAMLRSGALLLLSFGLVVAAQAAANPKAGDRPNPKSSEPHPGDTRSAEGKAKASERKESAEDRSALDRYDVNRNGKLDPDEIAAMQADKEKSGEKSRSKGKKSTR